MEDITENPTFLVSLVVVPLLTIAAYLYISKSQTKPAATEEAEYVPGYVTTGANNAGRALLQDPAKHA
jgi:hypothetical protein